MHRERRSFACLFYLIGALGVCRLRQSFAFLTRLPVSCSVLEGVPPGTSVVDLVENLVALDSNDLGLGPVYDQMTFSLTTGQYKDLFLINGSILTTASSLDREALCPLDPVCVLKVDVGVQFEGNFEMFKIEVAVQDINDNTPIFRQSSLSRSVSESTPPGFLFQVLPAYDLDIGSNSEIVYRLEADGAPFHLAVQNTTQGSQPTDLRLELAERLDREEKDHYDLKLLAVDQGHPSRTGSLLISIDVADVNDNSPKFEKDSYEATIDLSTAPGTLVTMVHASDPDDGANGQVRYHLSRKSQVLYGHLFSVDPISGMVRTRARLDSGLHTSYQLYVVAKDMGDNDTPTVTNLTVHLRATNDHTPQIHVNTLTGSTTRAEVSENAPPGSYVAHLTVDDRDVGVNGQVDCLTDNANFSLAPLRDKEYKLYTATSFDREENDEYAVVVSCVDRADHQQPRTGFATLSVVITDEDDNPPVFTRSLYDVAVTENNDRNSFLLQVQAADADVGRNAQVEYVLDADAENWFRVDAKTGVITTQVSFDREFVDEFDFHVIARGGNDGKDGSYRHVTRSRVHVTVTDVDDEPPRFTESWYKFDTRENENSGVQVGQVVAVDEDLPPYNTFSYHLEYSPEDGTSSNHFAVDPVSGTIYTRHTLDREALSHYTLRIRAKSSAKPALSDVTVVFIRVTDVNDNAPVFTFPLDDDASVVRLLVNLSLGDTVTTVRAYDRDLDGNAELTYSIEAGNENEHFRLDPTSGKLTWNSKTSPKSSKSCVEGLTVQAKDRGLPNALSTTVRVKFVCDDRVTLPGGRPDEDSVTGDADRKSEGGRGLSSLHFLILASVLACCIVVVIVLIAAICVTRDQTKMMKKREKARSKAAALDQQQQQLLQQQQQQQKQLLLQQPQLNGHERLLADGAALLMLDHHPKLSIDGETILLALRREPGCRLELQRLTPSDVIHNPTGVTSVTRDRDTDSGCVDVSPV